MADVRHDVVQNLEVFRMLEGAPDPVLSIRVEGQVVEVAVLEHKVPNTDPRERRGGSVSRDALGVCVPNLGVVDRPVRANCRVVCGPMRQEHSVVGMEDRHVLDVHELRALVAGSPASRLRDRL